VSGTIFSRYGTISDTSFPFIVCRQVVDDPQLNDSVIDGLPRAYNQKNYLGAGPLEFFVRLSSARGHYRVEIEPRWYTRLPHGRIPVEVRHGHNHSASD
jgi:hypothetical protein